MFFSSHKYREDPLACVKISIGKRKRNDDVSNGRCRYCIRPKDYWSLWAIYLGRVWQCWESFEYYDIHLLFEKTAKFVQNVPISGVDY